MTFMEIVTEIADRLSLTSPDAMTRIGRLVNSKYRQLTAEGWLQISRRTVSVLGATTEGVATVTFTGVEKLERVMDDHSGTSYTLEEVTFDDLRAVEPIASDAPRRYAVQTMGKNTVTIRIDVLPQTVFELKADGLANAPTLSGSQEPAFPESFHDLLIEAVLVDEYKRLHQIELSEMSRAVYEQRLSALKMFIAKSGSLGFRQGGRVNDPNSGRGTSGGGGSSATGALSFTQTGLMTFDRDPSAPFAVVPNSAGVANLDSDLLDGEHGSFYTDSENLSFLQAGTGAVARTMRSKARDVVSVKDFGAIGDGVTDDTAALQLAIDSGFPLYFPAGTYLVSLGTSITLEGGATVCALKAKTGMALQGAGIGKTIIKVKDNESTDASPKYWNVIAGNEVLEDVIIDGITFDMNGDNNKISPDRGVGTYNRFNCAALMVSGSIGTVGVDARLVNARITHCEFKNCPGVTCIAVAQSNATGTTLGSNIEIAHNVFHNNGIDSDDHSSVYMWAEGVSVHDNVFYHPTMSNGIAGPYAAAELHGARSTFRNNLVFNHPWGVYLAGNYTTVAHDLDVSSNTFIVAKKAAVLFVETDTEPGLRNVTIANNRIWLTDDFGSGESKKCLDLVTSQGAVDGVVVSGNIIYTTDTFGAYAVSVGAIAAGKEIRNVKVQGNVISGFATPISVGVAGDAGTALDVDICDNQLVGIDANTSVPEFSIGVYTTGTLGRVRIANNVISGGDAEHPYFGIYLDTGTISDLHMSGNAIDDNATAPISDNATVSGRRCGEQATTFSDLPDQSTWKIGDIAHNAAISELGSASSKYVLDGWRRITNGTGNVLNTDWVERRSLTGN